MPRTENDIIAFYRWRHIRKLSLFGSVLRDDFSDESDVDILVEFDSDLIPGLAFFAMQDELSSLLGRNVDFNTAGFLPVQLGERVVAEADVLHDAA